MWWVRFAAAQLVILIVLLEVVLRFYQPVVFRVRGDEIVLPVNQTYRIEKPGSTKLDPVIIHTKNSLGFRGPEPPRDFADRLTIVTIGGSTTECLNLTDGKTWTDELARRLDGALPGVWVNNAGIDGQSTFGHRILLDSVVTRLRPTVAVFLVGANDVGLEQSNTFDLGTIPTRRAAAIVSERGDCEVGGGQPRGELRSRGARARARVRPQRGGLARGRGLRAGQRRHRAHASASTPATSRPTASGSERLRR